jgi:mannose-6-phosphate isomerase-like protein (cupin superfamily)
MKGFIDHIDQSTEENTDFRRVLYTGKHLQLVLMSIAPGEDIGEEVHGGGDQFFRIEEGDGKVLIDGKSTDISDGDAFVVPAGARHNVLNSGEEPLRLYTLYGPPHHRDGFVAATKAKAEASNEHFDDRTTE